MSVKNLSFVDNNAPQCDAEFLNSVKDEINNSITKAGQTPAVADRFQLSKAIKDFVSSSSFYVDSGSKNSYVLTTLSPFQPARSYTDGMQVCFRAGSTSDAASTVNVDGIGIKSIKVFDPEAGTFGNVSSQIIAENDSKMRFNSSEDAFVIETSKEDSGVKILGEDFVETGAYISTSNNLPNDDTIWQNTEGAEILTLSYTPKSATSKITIEAGAVVSGSSNRLYVAIGLFKDLEADCIAQSNTGVIQSNHYAKPTILHEFTSGSTSEFTIKLRFSPDNGSAYLNGISSGRRFGGKLNTYIKITEKEE